MKIEVIHLITDIYLLIKDWNAGLIKTEEEFLITLREKVHELSGDLEQLDADIDYNE